MKRRSSRRQSEASPDHQIILLALSAALFAWLMRAMLDLYFYSEGTVSTNLFLGIPTRVLYSRVALATCFVLTGIVISHAVERLRRAHARERRLDKCVRSVRAINQLITRVEDRGALCQRACEELVSGLGYQRVRADLDDGTYGLAELPAKAEGVGPPAGRSQEIIPISCGGEGFGELVVTLFQDQTWDAEERALLREVAEDMAFSVKSMRTAEHLHRQKEEAQAILDSVSAYITYKDRSRRYIQVNRAMADMAGIPQEAWIGKTLAELVPGVEDLSRYADDEVMSTGGTKRTPLEALELPRGTRWLQSDRVPYRDDTGSIVGTITLSVDVTGRMEAERALSCKEEQLRQSQKMEAIGQLAGGIAHDFNNLLTAISGYTELASELLEPDEQPARMLTQVLESSDRAAALTRQLLAFSRKQSLWLTEQDINEVVSGMTDMLRPLIGADVELVTDLDEEAGAIEADAAQMEQVIMNLAVNARDAMPEGGRLSIATTAVAVPADPEDGGPQTDARDYVCLSVTDTGSGIDDSVRAKIFEPFFTTKKPGVGTGLGLSVVDGIVRQHGGWVRVESKAGRGTAFDVFLPKAVHDSEEESATPTLDKPAEKTPEAHGERVLLVEDEDTVRAFASRALSEWGYEIVEAPSAEEALVVLDMEPDGFDLVFSDIVLPGRSGTQLAEEIRARNLGARILLTSGYLFPDQPDGEPETAVMGFRLLKKPYSTSALRSAVHEVLG